MVSPALLLVAGLVLLVVGAEALVRGASRLAIAAGLSPLFIGLVVVSLGTSAPEVAVSVGASLQGRTDLAVGNVVGSNTFNVLFILGITALVAPLVVRQRLVRLDIPVMVGVSVLLLLLSLDGRVGILDGVLLLVLTALYLFVNLRLGKADAPDAPAPVEGAVDEAAVEQVARTRGRGLLVASLLALAGLGGLVLGAQWTVDAAVSIARAFGASDLVIGLTVVAAGTSLPEVATSVLAAARGQRDIAVGNIVGSNVLNITLILGLSSVVAPDGLAVTRGVLTFDLLVLVAVALAVLPVAFTGQVVARWEGGLFLAYYVAYVAHLLLTATEHDGADEFGFAMTWFVLPLTLIVVVATVAREVRYLRGRRST